MSPVTVARVPDGHERRASRSRPCAVTTRPRRARDAASTAVTVKGSKGELTAVGYQGRPDAPRRRCYGAGQEVHMKDVAVVAYCRTGIAKAVRGALNQTHGIPMTAHVLRNAVKRARIDPAEVEDVVVGCGLPEGATGHNIARNAALEAGFGVAVPGMTVNRYCGSGLSAASIVANRIATGEATIAIAAGVESISLVQFSLNLNGFFYEPCSSACRPCGGR